MLGIKSLKRNGKKGLGEDGLTLIEILAVVVLLGLIILFLITRVNSAGDKTNEMGVKTDFRTFQVASEQTLRDTTGFKNDDTGAAVSLDDAMLNELLDKGLQFATGVSAKKDPWGTSYTVKYSQATDPTATATANGDALIVITSNGKDKVVGNDDVFMATYYNDGTVSTCTKGYTGNKDLVADAFDLSGACGTAVQ
jgi:type II secretory pathway pseudopilin PulG